MVVVVVWYLDTWQGNKTNSKYISARRLTNHLLIMKTEFGPNNLPVKFRLPGNEDLLSVLNLQLALERRGDRKFARSPA